MIARIVPITIVLFLINTPIYMQAQDKSPVGEYYLTGVTETAAGFKINKDSTFEFFFSYGALDRSGSGTWAYKSGRVLFNSPNLGAPFLLSNLSKEAPGDITLHVTTPDPVFQSACFGILMNKGAMSEPVQCHNSVIRFQAQDTDSLMVLFEFTPEKRALFAFNSKEYNTAHLKPSETLLQVQFDHLSFVFDGNSLTGSLPLLKPGEYKFEKNGPRP